MTLQASVPVRILLFDRLSGKRIVQVYIWLFRWSSEDYVTFDKSVATHICDLMDR
jgi:hypothetical protein